MNTDVCLQHILAKCFHCYSRKKRLFLCSTYFQYSWYSIIINQRALAGIFFFVVIFSAMCFTLKRSSCVCVNHAPLSSMHFVVFFVATLIVLEWILAEEALSCLVERGWSVVEVTHTLFSINDTLSENGRDVCTTQNPTHEYICMHCHFYECVKAFVVLFGCDETKLRSWIFFFAVHLASTTAERSRSGKILLQANRSIFMYAHHKERDHERAW